MTTYSNIFFNDIICKRQRNSLILNIIFPVRITCKFLQKTLKNHFYIKTPPLLSDLDNFLEKIDHSILMKLQNYWHLRRSTKWGFFPASAPIPHVKPHSASVGSQSCKHMRMSIHGGSTEHAVNSDKQWVITHNIDCPCIPEAEENRSNPIEIKEAIIIDCLY